MRIGIGIGNGNGNGKDLSNFFVVLFVIIIPMVCPISDTYRYPVRATATYSRIRR
jgi:hypothetical protein